MLKLIRGDTWEITIPITDADGNAVDLTDARVYFTIKKFVDAPDSEAVVHKIITSHTDPTNGITKVTLEASETRGIHPATYYYDISIRFPDGKVMSTGAERLRVEYDVTQLED